VLDLALSLRLPPACFCSVLEGLVFFAAVRLPARLGLVVRFGFQFWAVGSVRHLAKADPFPASVLLEFAVATPGLGLLAPDRFFVQGPRHQQRFSLVPFFYSRSRSSTGRSLLLLPDLSCLWS
jgi:hypothetical protein